MKIKRVLVANRGEIAVRVTRACHDLGIEAVAVYSETDRNLMHVTMADHALALGGITAKDSYLDMAKIINAAKQTGADAIHPGYGFLSENAEFAKRVILENLIWIGPSPESISALGDKVKARHIAARVGAPLAPGTSDPVKDASEVIAFAEKYGTPIAIKAAFGGGGRGLKVAKSKDEIIPAFESAVREAEAAFGNGECFVERYLEKPRHVETQCLADSFGNVVVVSTRDCSLQRRHQKLVEEAPAPFLTAAQIAELYESSKAILKQANYQGAATCEFLVAQDGMISFLEVNTRLQVEHPVSEEVTGIDLVKWQIKIAQGEEINFADPEVRGHSIEFRINGEDPGKNFLPTPGFLKVFELPAGPGVRVDTGFKENDQIGQNFDSLLAKLIITGATRTEALQRAKRALAEFKVEGIATVIPFHQQVIEDVAFAPKDPNEKFRIYTSWIESEFDNQLVPYDELDPSQNPSLRSTVIVEVNNKRFEVNLPEELSIVRPKAKPAPRSKPHKFSAQAIDSNSISSPMQGTVVNVAVNLGQAVSQGDVVLVLEAMKMEQPIQAHKTGTVTRILVSAGEVVASGANLIEIED
ncbi:MAG: Acetyl-/propionyl-coenzyme carboxylase alpha chain : Biotin carboxylase [Actinomycetota bacterium]|jgi:acetyl-CoA/propionyl-CoA carboxylase biotin carboxyl carrier protein